MKTLVLSALLLMGNFAIFAQKTTENIQKNQEPVFETLFKSEKASFGWYAGMQWNYSPVDSKDAYIGGIRGGMVINHKLHLGLAFQGINNPNRFEQTIDDQKARLESGYGGLIVEPVLFNHKVVHVSFPVIIGGGGANWISKEKSWDDNDDDDDWDDKILETDTYFVFEPGINAEVNLLKFMRLGIGASYRYTSGFDLEKTSTHYLDGFNTGLTLKFGRF